MKYRAKVLINSKKRRFPIAVGYRPHIAKKDSDNLLGIEFIDLSDNKIDCVICTSYPWVDYKELKEGHTYYVREGRLLWEKLFY